MTFGPTDYGRPVIFKDSVRKAFRIPDQDEQTTQYRINIAAKSGELLDRLYAEHKLPRFDLPPVEDLAAEPRKGGTKAAFAYALECHNEAERAVTKELPPEPAISSPVPALPTASPVVGNPVVPDAQQPEAGSFTFKPDPCLVIVHAVCKHFGHEFVQLVGERKSETLVYARHIGMYVAHVLTGQGYPKIARRFGRRDHSTVWHAVHKIKARLELDEKVAADVAAVRALVLAALPLLGAQ